LYVNHTGGGNDICVQLRHMSKLEICPKGQLYVNVYIHLVCLSKLDMSNSSEKLKWVIGHMSNLDIHASWIYIQFGQTPNLPIGHMSNLDICASWTQKNVHPLYNSNGDLITNICFTIP